MTLNLDASQLLKLKGSNTGTLRELDILIPPIVIESTFLKDAEHVKVNTNSDGVVVLSPTIGMGQKLIDFRLAFPANLQEEVKWAPGNTLEFTIKEESVLVSKIDRLNHESFKNPSLHGKIPVPPAWMLQAFTGVPDIRGFLSSGPRSMKKILDTANKWGLATDEISNVLDFGCGCGRILGNWRETPHIKLTGCDLHNQAIDWCKDHYSEYDFYNGTELPPSPSKDNSFDLVYAISVLTHLDEAHQNAWLNEWKRVLRPGGLAIVTFRGEDFVQKVIKLEKRRTKVLDEILNGKGISFQERPGWEGVFESFYGGTYHSIEYVKKEWGKHFEILEMFKTGEFVNRQNSVVMRKK